MSLASVGSTCSVPVTLGLPLLTAHVLSPSTLLRLQAALQGVGPELCAVPIFGSSTKAQTRLGLRSVPSPAGAAHAARSLTGALSPGAVRLIPSVGPASVSTRAGSVRLCLFWGAGLQPRPFQRLSTIQELRKSFVRNWKPVCSLVGDTVSGAAFAPFPSPLPPASSRGWAGLPPASSSLELLSPSFVPKQCRLILSVQPPLAGGGCKSWGYFSAGSCFQASNLWVVFIFPLSYAALRDSKTSPRPASERVSWCLAISSIMTPFLGWVSIPSSFVPLFIFYILSYLLWKTMGYFSGRLMSSANDQRLFCGVYSAFKCSFNEFVGEKVVSPSYSSTILARPPTNVMLISFSRANLQPLL